MKRYILMLSVFAFGLGASAQITTHSSCDTNLNGEVTISDITNVANKVIGNTTEEKEVVTAEQLNVVFGNVNNHLDRLEQKNSKMDYLRAAITSIAELVGARSPEYYEKYGVHEYVDLGFTSGTLWATCNVGADSPEEYGDYFAWGETEPQADHGYSWASYSLCKGSATTMTKYCKTNSYGTPDNKTELDPADDAATVNWGEDWQMPSYEQFRELYINTTFTWTTLNGVYGGLLTSKIEGYTDKYIFIPTAGYYKESTLIDAGSIGILWSRSLHKSNYSDAYEMGINTNGLDPSSENRYQGYSIRPVRVKK